MEIIRPIRQGTWNLTAVLNFWLGGMASGAYIVAIIILTESDQSLSGAFQLLVFLLIGTGLSALLLHIGEPRRIKFAARNLQSSWMARETFASVLFFTTAIWYFFFPNASIGWLASFAAFCFLISQSFILYAAKGTSGWDSPVVPVHFTLSSFSSGSGLLLLATPFRTVATLRVLETTAIILVIANSVVWLLYLYEAPESYEQTLSSLKNLKTHLLVLGGGLILPLMLLLMLVFQVSEEKLLSGWMRINEVIAGLCLIGGALAQKYLVIIRAGWSKQLFLK